MVENSSELVANIGQFVIGMNTQVLTCLGLGSCVGVAIFDNNLQFAGLMHVMLPECPVDKSDDSNVFKYADKGLPLMIDELIRKGCDKSHLKAKIAGGAHMFKDTVRSDLLDIGKRNVEAVLKVLNENNILLISKDIGGNVGRTMRLHINSGEVIIKTKDGVSSI